MGLLTDVADIIRNVVNSAVGGKTSSGSGGTRTSGSSSTSGTSGTKGTSAAASSGYYNPNKDYSAAILNAQKSGASQQVISRLQQERQNKINAQYGGVDPYKGSEDIMGTGGSGTGSSGSSQYASGWTPGAGYTEKFDADANLSRETLDKIQSFREQAKEGLISWSEANAAANALRAAEGGYTLDMSGNPSWVGPPEVEIPSFEEFLEQTGYDQYSEATQQRIQAAVDQAISGYNAQIEAANKDSDALARQAYVAKMLGQKNLDQQLSAAGYAGGMADSQRIQTEISYENNLQDIEEQRLAVIAELERAIRDAQLTGDLQGAQELQAYLQQMQQSWLTYVQNQQAIQNSNYWNQRQAQSSDYWNDRQLSADEKNTAYNRALELLSFGIMPGEDVLTQAGLSQQEAAAIRDRLTAEQIAAAGTRSGTSSGGGSSSGGSSRTAAYNNGSLTVDQVKEIQQYMGVTPTGMWDSSSYAAAGNLTADEAWEAFMNSGGDGENDPGNEKRIPVESLVSQIRNLIGRSRKQDALNVIAGNWQRLTAAERNRIQSVLGEYGYTYEE